jgi:hypothetical protein
MPQYLVGHLNLVDEIDRRAARHLGLTLAGSAYRGVGLADCVRSGEAAAEAILARGYPLRLRSGQASTGSGQAPHNPGLLFPGFHYVSSRLLAVI